jgi:hypothetical protein
MIDKRSNTDYLTGMAKRTESFTDQMRRLIADSGQSCYAIAKATGIDPASLSRFLSGKTGLLLRQVETMADYLGWRIVADEKVAGSERRRKGRKATKGD